MNIVHSIITRNWRTGRATLVYSVAMEGDRFLTSNHFSDVSQCIIERVLQCIFLECRGKRAQFLLCPFAKWQLHSHARHTTHAGHTTSRNSLTLFRTICDQRIR